MSVRGFWATGGVGSEGGMGGPGHELRGRPSMVAVTWHRGERVASGRGRSKDVAWSAWGTMGAWRRKGLVLHGLELGPRGNGGGRGRRRQVGFTCQ